MNERLIPIFKQEGLDKLKNSYVAIVGVGGVGGLVAITLARCGVGHIIIQDFDKVEASNINRQLVANNNTLGMYKVDVLKKFISEINPNCEIITLKSFFSYENIAIFNEKIDFLVDAIDSVDSKCCLINECLNRNINFISSMGAAKKVDPKLVKVIRIDKTTYDPIAKIIRSRFKNQKFMTVSSTEKAVCSEMGSYMPVVNTFSLLIADYVIKYLTGGLQ